MQTVYLYCKEQRNAFTSGPGLAPYGVLLQCSCSEKTKIFCHLVRSGRSPWFGEVYFVYPRLAIAEQLLAQ